MSSPSTRMFPVIRTPSTESSSRLKDLRSVVLPQPDGPMMTVIFRSGMSRVTFLRTRLVAVGHAQVPDLDVR